MTINMLLSVCIDFYFTYTKHHVENISLMQIKLSSLRAPPFPMLFANQLSNLISNLMINCLNMLDIKQI